MIFIAVVAIQFLTRLFTGQPLKHLTVFGDSLADYMAQIVRFESFVTEDLAFPFAAWPSSAIEEQASPPPQPRETGPNADRVDEGKVPPKKKPRTRRTQKTETP